ncbi:MAG: DinB family protein [Planctomycetes bacterium]|nr:DinB family protein [Planctomycetota bacterium]
MGIPQVEVTLSLLEMFRERTLATLAAIEKLPHPEKALGWRPGPGRAHIGWQMMHIAVTEELFATERFLGTAPAYPELVPRFKGGSTPDDNIPSLSELRDVLTQSRSHLRATLLKLTEADLGVIPEALKQRGLTIGKALQIIAWHETHHQGQAHITLNLFNAAGVS